MPPVIDQTKCIGCGTCADICNSDIFVFERKKDKFPQIKYPEECWHCDSCVMDCPRGAISLRIPLAFKLLTVPSSTLCRKEESR